MQASITGEQVDWYNNRRLLGPIGYITPAEAEEAFYANLNTLDMVAQYGLIGLRQNRGGSNLRFVLHKSR